MIVPMPEEVLYKLIDYARGVGQKEERINSSKEPQFISQNKAHKKYGKGDVSKWVKAGLVKRYKDADGKTLSRVRYDVLELESAAFKCNCIKELSPLAKAEMKEIISK